MEKERLLCRDKEGPRTARQPLAAAEMRDGDQESKEPRQQEPCEQTVVEERAMERQRGGTETGRQIDKQTSRQADKQHEEGGVVWWCAQKCVFAASFFFLRLVLFSPCFLFFTPLSPPPPPHRPPPHPHSTLTPPLFPLFLCVSLCTFVPSSLHPPSTLFFLIPHLHHFSLSLSPLHISILSTASIMGATHSSLAHSPSPRAGHASNPAKSRNSFTKDRFLSHTLPTAPSSNSHSAYPSPTYSTSTIGSHHHLQPSSSAPGSPTQYHSHPQYTNHHHNNTSHTHHQHHHHHHHHPQHSMASPASSHTSNSSTLQKTFSRRRSSNQTVESSSSGQCSVLHGSTTHSNTSHPLARHSEETDQEFRFFFGRRFHNTSSLYMLPNDTQEVDRLHEQHYILKILFEGKNIHVSVKDNDKVIDLGCGAATWIMENVLLVQEPKGTVARVRDPEQLHVSSPCEVIVRDFVSIVYGGGHDMATELNHVDFVGIDISPIYPTAIHPKNCSFYQENILQGISQPNESFHIAYQRNVAPGFTFEHWQQGLGEAFRILKGDGWLESVESDVTIHNAGPYTEMCFEYLRASMASRNVDPSVVRDLDKLFLSTGFVDVQVKEYVVAYGEHGGQLGKLWRDNMFAILETVKPLLARAKNVPESQVSEMIAASYKETLTCRAHQTIYVTYGRKPKSAALYGR